MKVPLLDLNAQNAPLEKDLKAAFERVLQSGRFILGPEVEALESRIAAMAGARHGIGVSSGTDALLLALMALDLGPGDEVLCPTFTFFATAGCIARTGATPVFVDALEDTFNLDMRDAARKVSRRTRAIIPVHLFGQAAEMDAVTAFAQEHDLAVIEDGAQALGARYKDQPVGGLGTFGTFSFFPSKNLGGFGDGGMLVCQDDALAEKARTLRAHGSKPKYYHQFVGANFRLDPLQAALLLVKLPHYDQYTRNRQRNAACYHDELQKIPGVVVGPGGGEEALLRLPVVDPDCHHIWNQYTLRVPGRGRRDRLRQHLAECGIGSEIYYPLTMDAQECFASLGQQASCPVASRLSTEVLSIPIYPELSEPARQHVVAAVGFHLASVLTGS